MTTGTLEAHLGGGWGRMRRGGGGAGNAERRTVYMYMRVYVCLYIARQVGLTLCEFVRMCLSICLYVRR